MSTRNPEPIFDSAPHPFGAGPCEPLIYDASAPALRQRSVNFAAKRYADMLFVTGLDRATADAHFRARAAQVPAGLDGRAEALDIGAELRDAVGAGKFKVAADAANRTVTVTWGDVAGSARMYPGYGSILIGSHAAPKFDPVAISRSPAADIPVDPVATPAALGAAVDAFFAGSKGIYGVVVANPDRVLFERYSDFATPAMATPSWSMTKAITCTQIGRMIREGWLHSVHDPAPAPLWADPRGIHRLITIDHLLRMRSGLGFPVAHPDGRTGLGFENSAVYQDASDAFEAAQRSLVAVMPGTVFRYINAGINVLGSVIRDKIERRGLPYAATLYGLLADPLGMASYQQSADIAGNFIASGAGYATARDYAKLGLLYAQDGVWRGQRLLPEGWVDYALNATHTGTSYAACFRTNTDALFPELPADIAWAAGASDNKIFVLRRQKLAIAVTNETDYKMDLGALGRMVAAAADTLGR